MNTELLRRILDDARDNAKNPADAMAIEDLMRDVQDVETLTTDLCLDEIPAQLKTLADVREHIAAQPFETRDDEEAGLCIDELTPGAFAAWLGDLEYIAS